MTAEAVDERQDVNVFLVVVRRGGKQFALIASPGPFGSGGDIPDQRTVRVEVFRAWHLRRYRSHQRTLLLIQTNL